MVGWSLVSGFSSDNDFERQPNIVNVELTPIPFSKPSHSVPGQK